MRKKRYSLGEGTMKFVRPLSLGLIALSSFSITSVASAESASCRTKRLNFENAVAAVNASRGPWREPLYQAYLKAAASDYFNHCGLT
jgi:hypothetical protein